jgi:tRNA nucleotidyltransferase (CCA-adding enzyme)
MVLDQAVRLSADARVRFAALVHDLGKGATPPEQWPAHHGHEERSVALIEALAARLKVPADYRELAVIVARHHGIVHRAFELKPRTVLEFIERADAVRRPERFDQVLLACEADARGRLGLEDRPYPQREYLIAARGAAAAIKPSAEELAAPGPIIKQHLHRRRLATITAVREQFEPQPGAG